MYKTAETVSPGHPDKIADLISDYVLTEALSNNKKSRVAVETFLTGTSYGGLVVVGGEISEIANVDDETVNKIVKEALSKTIKTSFEDFQLDNLKIQNELTPQSEEIRSAVEDDKDLGAGDQGIMVGYATNETKSLMPETFDISRNIQMSLWDIQNNDESLDLDSKVQVTTGGKKTKVVISTQHKKDIDIDGLRNNLEEMIGTLVNNDFQFDLNPSGSFVKGGPAGDTGLTGRKIVVDAYGPTVPVGGGAFSGKDPSKVDRSAAYAGRWVAKNVVAAGLAERCQVALAYSIGVADPVWIDVQTFGTETESIDSIKSKINNNFDLRPRGIIEDMDLLRPIYTETSAYGHFGRDNLDFSWEKTDNLQ